MSNSDPKHPAALRHLHWLIAILIVIAAGLILSSAYIKYFMAPPRGTPLNDLRISLLIGHETAAFFALIFAVIRAMFTHRYRHNRLASVNPLHSPKWYAEQAVHFMLQYGVIVLIILGWLTANARGITVKLFTLIPIPTLVSAVDMDAPGLFFDILLNQRAHTLLGYAIIACIGMHVAAVLFHQIIEKKKILQRMM